MGSSSSAGRRVKPVSLQTGAEACQSSCLCVPHCRLFVPVQGVSYELYATVDHVGDLRGGHYTATIQPPDDGGRWYDFNNSMVTPVSLASLWQTLAIV